MDDKRVEFRSSQAIDVFAIADRMRHADKVEVWASSRRSPEEALAHCLAKTDFAVTAFLDGVPEAMFGCGSVNVLARVAAPWFLGTPAIEREPRLFLRHAVGWRKQLLERYDVLRNAVHDDNEVAKRWLRWMGFTLSDPMPLGFEGEAFRVFELRA